MFDLQMFLRARQVRVMCDALFAVSGGDDAEAAIDSVHHVVVCLAGRLGADDTTAQLVGRYWTIELFFGYDAYGDKPGTTESRYSDEPTLGEACAEALFDEGDDLRLTMGWVEGQDDDLGELWATASRLREGLIA